MRIGTIQWLYEHCKHFDFDFTAHLITAKATSSLENVLHYEPQTLKQLLK